MNQPPDELPPDFDQEEAPPQPTARGSGIVDEEALRRQVNTESWADTAEEDHENASASKRRTPCSCSGSVKPPALIDDFFKKSPPDQMEIYQTLYQSWLKWKAQERMDEGSLKTTSTSKPWKKVTLSILVIIVAIVIGMIIALKWMAPKASHGAEKVIHDQAVVLDTKALAKELGPLIRVEVPQTNVVALAKELGPQVKISSAAPASLPPESLTAIGKEAANAVAEKLKSGEITLPAPTVKETTTVTTPAAPPKLELTAEDAARLSEQMAPHLAKGLLETLFYRGVPTGQGTVSGALTAPDKDGDRGLWVGVTAKAAKKK